MIENHKTSGGVSAPFVAVLRPAHWVKNLFVFAALVFAGRLLDAQAWLAAGAAFAGFCLLSSAGYIINDIADLEQDRLHPTKRLRPIASGRIGRGRAAVIAAVCLVVGTVTCALVNAPLLVVSLSYVLFNLIYTFWLKHHMLVDVMCIAAGFVLRAFAGGVAIGVPVSLWLLACTFTLCMFLGFGKRRCEVAQLGGNRAAAAHRATLGGYTLPLLDQLLSVSGGVAIVTYILYTVDPRTIAKLETPYLFFSAPLVIYCIFRYALLVEAGRVSGPAEAVTRDRPFVVALLLWAVYAGAVVTFGPAISNLLSGIGPLLER